jgi:hypothetical protein
MSDDMEISWGIDEPDKPEEPDHEGDGQSDGGRGE